MNFSWPGLLVLVMIWLLVIYLEWQRKRKRFFILRLSMASIAILALGCVLWKPALPGEKVVDVVILIGKETRQNVLDSLKKEYTSAKLIHNDTLFNEVNANNIILTGQGLPVYDLWKIRNSNITFVSDPLPEGIHYFQPPGYARMGDSIRFTGRYGSPDTVMIKLIRNGMVTDSTRTDTTGVFQLSFLPKVPGRQLFSIVGVHPDKEIVYEVGVDVEEIEKQTVAMFLSYPTFEARGLKEYLGQNGFQVMVRREISRNKFSYEFSNMPDGKSIRFNDALIGELDLLVADQSFLESLSSDRLQILENAVRNGMGLLIFPDNGNSGIGSFTLPLIPDTGGQYILNDIAGVLPSYTKEAGIIAGGKRLGQGIVSTSLEPATYTWMLEGEETKYNTYWSDLITLAIKKPDRTIQLETWPMKVDHPAVITIESSDIPEILWNGRSISPQGDMYQENNWNVQIWALDSGWHQIISARDTVSYYVYGENDWHAMQLNEQQSAVRREIKETSHNKNGFIGYSPVSKWIFFLLFLLAMSFIWVEPKI